MSIKIHYGPPGSYKTSGAMMDDFVAAVFEGRVVVTNVRGLDSRERVFEILTREFPKKEIPDSFELLFVNSETKEGEEKWKRFFHWVCPGAFLLVDEAQKVWRKSWRDSDLKQFDYEGGPDKAEEDGQPPDFDTAFEKHRHYNWDMVLTTPDIRLIRPDIRGCSEGAFKHKNQALVGFGGRYLEGFHMAEDTGTEANFLNVVQKKVPKYVFELYQSTTTGQFRDTQAGTSIFKNPKFLFLVAFLLVVIILVFNAGMPSFWKGRSNESKRIQEVPVSDSVAGLQNNKNDLVVNQTSVKGGVASADIPVGGAGSSVINNLTGKGIWYLGSMFKEFSGSKQKVYLFEVTGEDETHGAMIDSSAFERLGYEIKNMGSCLISLKKSGQEIFARCRGIKDESKKF